MRRFNSPDKEILEAIEQIKDVHIEQEQKELLAFRKKVINDLTALLSKSTSYDLESDDSWSSDTSTEIASNGLPSSESVFEVNAVWDEIKVNQILPKLKNIETDFTSKTEGNPDVSISKIKTALNTVYRTLKKKIEPNKPLPPPVPRSVKSEKSEPPRFIPKPPPGPRLRSAAQFHAFNGDVAKLKSRFDQHDKYFSEMSKNLNYDPISEATGLVKRAQSILEIEVIKNIVLGGEKPRAWVHQPMCCNRDAGRDCFVLPPEIEKIKTRTGVVEKVKRAYGTSITWHPKDPTSVTSGDIFLTSLTMQKFYRQCDVSARGCQDYKTENYKSGLSAQMGTRLEYLDHYLTYLGKPLTPAADPKATLINELRAYINLMKEKQNEAKINGNGIKGNYNSFFARINPFFKFDWQTKINAAEWLLGAVLNPHSSTAASLDPLRCYSALHDGTLGNIVRRFEENKGTLPLLASRNERECKRSM